MIPFYLYTLSCKTGSNYICNPPVTNTDIDELFLVTDLEKSINTLINLGWERCGKEEYGIGNWVAYRKGNLNALLTNDYNYFMQFLKATEEAKRLNLLEKKDRISLFERYLKKNVQMW